MLAYQVCECTRSAPTQSRGHRAGRRRASAGPALARGQLGRSAYPVVPGLVARPAEAAHPHVDVAAGAQGPHQLGDVHARPAVDLRRVLLAQDVDAHAGHR